MTRPGYDWQDAKPRSPMPIIPMDVLPIVPFLDRTARRLSIAIVLGLLPVSVAVWMRWL